MAIICDNNLGLVFMFGTSRNGYVPYCVVYFVAQVAAHQIIGKTFVNDKAFDF